MDKKFEDRVVEEVLVETKKECAHLIKRTMESMIKCRKAYKKEFNKLWESALKKFKMKNAEFIELIESEGDENKAITKFYDEVSKFQSKIESKYGFSIEHEETMIFIHCYGNPLHVKMWTDEENVLEDAFDVELDYDTEKAVKLAIQQTSTQILERARNFNGQIKSIDDLFKHLDRVQKCDNCGLSFWDKPCPDCRNKEIERNQDEIFKEIGKEFGMGNACDCSENCNCWENFIKKFGVKK